MSSLGGKGLICCQLLIICITSICSIDKLTSIYECYYELKNRNWVEIKESSSDENGQKGLSFAIDSACPKA